jgi:hypothetical protein
LSDVFIPIEAAEKKTHQSSDAAVLIFGDFSPVVLLKSLAENPNISGVKIPTVLGGIPIFTGRARFH